MTKGLSTPKSFRWLIIQHYYAGIDQDWIANATAVGIRTVKRIIAAFKLWQNVYPASSKKGRLSKIYEEKIEEHSHR